MKKFLLTIAAVIVVTVSGCATYGTGATVPSLNSGTQPAQGPFPSGVIGA